MAVVTVTLTLLSFLSSARAGCEDAGALVAEVEQAVLDAQFEQARSFADRVEAAFGCGGTADATLLARLWLAEGAMAHVEGDPIGRDQAFASAWRVAPMYWTEAFGPELRAAWEKASRERRGRGRLEVDGLQAGLVARVDGAPLPLPIELESGLYLVQAGQDGGRPVFSRIVMVPDAQTLVVRVEAPATGLAGGEPTSARARRDRKGTGWYAGAGAAVLLSGTGFLLANAQNPVMREASDVDTLNAAFGRQKAFSYGGYGMLGLGAVCLGVGLAW